MFKLISLFSLAIGSVGMAHVDVETKVASLRISGADLIQKFSPEHSGLNAREGCDLVYEKQKPVKIDCWYVDYAQYGEHKFTLRLNPQDKVVYKRVNGGDCYEISGPTAAQLLVQAGVESMDECYHYDFWKPIEEADKRRLQLEKEAPAYVSDDPYHP